MKRVTFLGRPDYPGEPIRLAGFEDWKPGDYRDVTPSLAAAHGYDDADAYAEAFAATYNANQAEALFTVEDAPEAVTEGQNPASDGNTATGSTDDATPARKTATKAAQATTPDSAPATATKE